MTITI